LCDGALVLVDCLEGVQTQVSFEKTGDGLERRCRANMSNEKGELAGGVEALRSQHELRNSSSGRRRSIGMLGREAGVMGSRSAIKEGAVLMNRR
jgi:hypothetical protein